MNFGKLVISLPLVLFFISFIDFSFARAEEKHRKNIVKGQGHGTGLESGGYKGPEGVPTHIQYTIEEIKTLTESLKKKSSVNRNIILGTAVTNIALLLVLTGLMGYNLSQSHSAVNLLKDDKNKDKNSGRDNDEGRTE